MRTYDEMHQVPKRRDFFRRRWYWSIPHLTSDSRSRLHNVVARERLARAARALVQGHVRRRTGHVQVRPSFCYLFCSLASMYPHKDPRNSLSPYLALLLSRSHSLTLSSSLSPPPLPFLSLPLSLSFTSLYIYISLYVTLSASSLSMYVSCASCHEIHTPQLGEL